LSRKQNTSNVFEFFLSRYLIINDISQKEEEEETMKSCEQFIFTVKGKSKRKKTYQSMNAIVILRDSDKEKTQI